MSYSNFDEELISAVRENPVLYNKGSRNYKNVAAKAEKWAKISQNLGVSENECTSRWRALRDRYMQERKMRRSMASGSASSSKPTWKFFHALSFLDDFDKSGESIGNYSNIGHAVENNVPMFEENALQFDEVVEELDFSTSTNVVDVDPLTSNSNTYSSSEEENMMEAVGKELLSTMIVLKEYMTNSINEGTSPNAAFLRKVYALLDGLSNKELAQRKIIEYLCKCQTKPNIWRSLLSGLQ